ncbi:MAG: CutC family protein [Rhodoglobus sp.]|nr:CutC family protein [Rhodoglobus sp.]
MKLEIAVQDVSGITVAARAGVDRVELCSALALGGLTPSAGLVALALKAAGPLPVHVLVRARPGDFSYTEDELRVMVADVRSAVAAGAAGVVVGALRGGAVDAAALERLVDAAGGTDVTFHRAFDLLADPVAGLASLSAAGVRRILTSGGASTAVDGMPALRDLVQAGAGRIEIMAGGGVTIESIAGIAATGVDAVHLSAKRIRSTPGGFSIGSGTAEGTMEWDETDPSLVARARAAVSGG